ncbi:MAG: hypothetical protein AAF371_10580 [Pseudomonadota bacterium]
MKDVEDDDRSGANTDASETVRPGFLASPYLWVAALLFWGVVIYLIF